MKTLLLFIVLASYAFSQPEVGFLRVYHCMHEGIEFTPYVGEKPLSATPMNAGDHISGMYFDAGEYVLSLKSEDFQLEPMRIKIEANQTLTLIASQTINPKTEKSVPRLTVLPRNFPETTSPDTVPLSIISFSRIDLLLETSFDQLFLPAMEALSYEKWKGGAFSLKVPDQNLGYFQPENRIPHTLLVWDNSTESQQAILIPDTQLRPPVGLRIDLSFGKKRKEFKTLKKLTPREPKP